MMERKKWEGGGAWKKQNNDKILVHMLLPLDTLTVTDCNSPTRAKYPRLISESHCRQIVIPRQQMEFTVLMKLVGTEYALTNKAADKEVIEM